MNLKSQSTVWDWSEAEALAGFPDQHRSWQKQHLMPLSSCVQQQVEQGGRTSFWTTLRMATLGSISGCSPAGTSLPSALSLGSAAASKLFLSPPPRFCWRHFGCHPAQQGAELTWVSRKLVGLWSQRLLCGLLQRQYIYPFLSETEWKDRNEWMRCKNVMGLDALFPHLLWIFSVLKFIK